MALDSLSCQIYAFVLSHLRGGDMKDPEERIQMLVK